MLNYTREQLNERYKSLPKDVQQAIVGIETADIIYKIGDEKKMMIDKIGDLAEETSLVLLGFTHPSQFVSHLSERLGIEKPLAKDIAEEINSRIFFPVRENLKRIHGLREEEYEKEEEIQPASKPGFESEIEKAPTAPTLPPLPSALIPEPVVLETTIPVQPVPVEPETALAETPVQPVASIFEAKTKEISRLPAEVSEKSTESSLAKTAENKKADPYREPII